MDDIMNYLLIIGDLEVQNRKNLSEINKMRRENEQLQIRIKELETKTE